MRKIEFDGLCIAKYKGSIEIPDDIADKDIQDYIADHISDVDIQDLQYHDDMPYKEDNVKNLLTPIEFPRLYIHLDELYNRLASEGRKVTKHPEDIRHKRSEIELKYGCLVRTLEDYGWNYNYYDKEGINHEVDNGELCMVLENDDNDSLLLQQYDSQKPFRLSTYEAECGCTYPDAEKDKEEDLER